MTFLRDLRFAARQLRLAPGYTAAAIVTLALAIGASTAIFSAVYAVLLKPMPIREPQQLVIGWGTSAALNMRVIELSYLDIQDIGAATTRGRHGRLGRIVGLDGRARRRRRRRAAQGGQHRRVGHVLRGAGRRAAALGRVIRPDDDRTNSARVVVLSHGLWSTRFGADPNIVGRKHAVRRSPHEVIGVMPASFNYPQGTQAWSADRADPRRRCPSSKAAIPIRCAMSACCS